jgi:broad specificity phosphatase PhoE
VNNNCTFYLVRHGETEWNAIHRIQGHLDSKLTENGKNQVKVAREKFKGIRFDAVYSSDLIRTKQTADILVLEKNLKILTTKALRERTFGEGDGMMRIEYEEKTKHLLEKYNKLSEEKKFKFKFVKGYESDEELMFRFITFLREAAIAYRGKTVLIVTHSGNLRMFLVKLGFAGRGKLNHGTFKNAGYIVVESDGSDFFLKEVEGIVSV